ncbi:MAG: hypothetical protein WC955_09420 [Elusimicrobiota bacterium]
MNQKKLVFALYFGNRGFFPASLIAQARRELVQVLKKNGYGYIILNENATRYGAVETSKEGEVYAKFLDRNRGNYDGVILSLPNFGDENGAVAALKNAGVPILVQAYPDELTKMSPDKRRDAYCGKLSVMDMFVQYGIKFTALPPHTLAPTTAEFAVQVDYFARVCRVVNKLKNMTVGAIGARTTAFKTVRIDEVALQNNGITMETYDFSEVLYRIQKVNEKSARYKGVALKLRKYSDWTSVPEEAFRNIVKLGIAVEDIINENTLDAVAVRCWVEMQKMLGISPCVYMSMLNNAGIPAACEVDIGSAVTMYALQQASGNVSACLDWNNNYGDNPDKCILFHCGPIPQAMMKEKGKVVDHAILANDKEVGPNRSFGPNHGRIAAGEFTFASMLTSKGKLRFYAGEGVFTDDKIPPDFFGCAGVAEIPSLQDVLLYIGKNGHRHHVAITTGHVLDPVTEALSNYLGFDVALPQKKG